MDSARRVFAEDHPTRVDYQSHLDRIEKALKGKPNP